MKLRFCLHKWVSIQKPLGWVVNEFYYRQCSKCKRYEARGPHGWACDFWQEIQVPPAGYDAERERKYQALQTEITEGLANLRRELDQQLLRKAAE